MSQMHAYNCHTANTDRRVAVNLSICSRNPGNNLIQLKAATIDDSLTGFLVNHTMPGLQADQSRKRFIQCLFESWVRHAIDGELSSQKINGLADPNSHSFNPRLAILENYQKGQLDESIWLAFIGIHFGLETDLVRVFYGRCGEGRWDWKSVVEDFEGLHAYCQMNHERLRQLKFGNHRKFESYDSDKSVGIPNVIRSFITWVVENGAGSPYKAFSTAITKASSYENAFDRLYRNLQVLRFGRTAKFDLLTLLGNLKVLPIRPGHCYLCGSTGPKDGALLMVTGSKQGKLSNTVERAILSLQKHLDAPANVLEDALCNWQKTA